jgi:predicted CXXCH cytochrome family protein
VRVCLAVLATLLARPVLATGGHEKLGCVGCHAMHASQGELLATVPANEQMAEGRTGKPHGPLTALCLSCHADVADGGKGIRPISGHIIHPFSIEHPNPRIARVPEELLRGGRFECVSCHDPHPSNPNYRYLRIPVTSAAGVSTLCVVCHTRKADPNAAPARLFSSMDEGEPAAAGR